MPTIVNPETLKGLTPKQQAEILLHAAAEKAKSGEVSARDLGAIAKAAEIADRPPRAKPARIR